MRVRDMTERERTNGKVEQGGAQMETEYVRSDRTGGPSDCSPLRRQPGDSQASLLQLPQINELLHPFKPNEAA